MPRTNNKIEGWHRGIQGMFLTPKPNPWKCMAVLQKEQILQHAEFAQLQAGGQGKVMEKRYKDMNERLQRLVAGDQPVLEFLRNVARNLEMDCCSA